MNFPDNMPSNFPAEDHDIRHPKHPKILIAAAVVALLASGSAVWSLSLRPERVNVLRANGDPQVVVMDFKSPMALDPPPAGWYHRTFWTRRAAVFSQAVKAGVPALRVETADSASMLFRHVDIDLSAYPTLQWRWFVEKPIVSEIDERTSAGDDHPARLFITFEDRGGERRSMEIIWGNRHLKRGDYKYLGTFPHYVANGGAANVGRWHRERVDLLAIYRKLWPGGTKARVVDIAVFCDSDETATASISYFADLRMMRKDAPPIGGARPVR